MLARGALLFRPAILAELRTLVPAFARPFPPLQRREVAWLLQWEAPAEVLGTFPASPHVLADRIIATSQDPLAERLTELQRLVDGWLGSSDSVQLEELQSGHNMAVSLYIELGSTIPQWRPYVHAGSASRPHFEPGFAAS
jgi:hypothetical protein